MKQGIPIYGHRIGEIAGGDGRAALNRILKIDDTMLTIVGSSSEISVPLSWITTISEATKMTPRQVMEFLQTK